jgi:hypothetical protein
MPEVFSLLDSLLNRYHSPDNFPYFSSFVLQTLELYEIENGFIVLLLNHVTSRLNATRCLATALFIR